MHPSAFTDQTIRSKYPNLGRLVGYAVTCVYGLPDPNYNGLTFMDIVSPTRLRILTLN